MGRSNAIRLLSLAAALAAVPSAAAATFTPAVRFPAGPSPAALAAGDFNGDGKADLATADQTTDSVAVLLGTGGGSFGAPHSFATGPGPSDILVADLNDDGVSDLATANYAGGGPDGSASVLLGRGDGTFEAPRTFATAPGSFGIAAGDLSGDGVSDLATANTFSENVSVLFGNGDGSFAAATQVWAGVYTWPWALAIVDVDGAGNEDLAIANYHSSTVGIVRSVPGGFSYLTEYGTGSHPVGIVGADFNGDGRVDLATADLHGDTISVLLGTGTGAFGTAEHYPVGSGPSANVEYPSAIAVGDLDGDRRLDLAAPDYETSRVSFLLGKGDGTFEAAQQAATEAKPADIAAADLDGDKLADLATANYDDSSASVLRHPLPSPPSDGTPEPVQPVATVAPPPPPGGGLRPAGPPTSPPPRPVFVTLFQLAKNRPRAGHHFVGVRAVRRPGLQFSCTGRVDHTRLRPRVVPYRNAQLACIWKLPRRSRGALFRITAVARADGLAHGIKHAWRVA